MEDHIKETKTSTPSAPPKKDPKKESMEYQRAKDKEMVKGIFKFYEVPGGLLEFVFKKYKGDEVVTYRMFDGMQYTIPLGVAKHLNKDCWYPIHTFTTDENGKAAQKIGEKVQRVGFHSLEFIDIDDLSPAGKSVITVENVY